MGKTVFNPITTKWRGAIGGFRYSVVRGKQVIAERASAVKNPRTKGQMETRVKFKLASQFSNLWKDIITLNLAKKEHDKVLTRAMATQVAFDAAQLENEASGVAAKVDLLNFADDFNGKTNQPKDAGLSVVFTSSAQTLTATSGDTVVYKVVAFDEQNTPIGSNVTTYVSDGTAKMVDLPVIYGEAVRYDIVAFNITPSEGAAEFTGKISNMQGRADMQNMYGLLAKAAADSLITINGLQTESYLVA